MAAEFGDRVKVLCRDEVIEGILIQRPEIFPPNIIVVKLDSGYNIGVDKKKIKRIEVLQKYRPSRKRKIKLKFNKKLPTVAVLSTGGTISSRVDYKTGGVSAEFCAEDLVEMIPELKNVANIKAKKIMGKMSEDLTPKDWLKIAHEIAKIIKDVDGVVVTHGTDTFHYTTAAVSFILQNLTKPVVFTAAQRSIDRGSSDAYMNLLCAVTAAAKFNCSEVLTCMHGTTNDDYCLLIRGTKTRKMHSSRRDAFRPINEKAIARVFPNGVIEEISPEYKKRIIDKTAKTTVDEKLNEKVAMIFVYPNMDAGVIDYHVNKGYKGIVLAATALGHVPTDSKKSLLPGIERAMKKGVPVVIASQTIYGHVHPYVYTNLRRLSIELKAIFVEDMMPEVAYIKLMYALGHAKKLEDVKEIMLRDIAGEMTEREPLDVFLQ
jgi:glutamyl-tRNA(Gln) amidotransferase subunit D